MANKKPTKQVIKEMDELSKRIVSDIQKLYKLAMQIPHKDIPMYTEESARCFKRIKKQLL
jgi:hypothetical protein